MLSRSYYCYALDMERVSTQSHSANQTYLVLYRNECNVVIIAACLPTLRPLFLIILNRSARNEYLRRKPYHPSPPNPGIRRRFGRDASPVSEWTTAIGHHDQRDSWMELNHNSSNSNGNIKRTVEFGVTRHAKTGLPDADDITMVADGNTV